MAKTNCSACATKPEEIVICTVLDAGNYPEEYAERVKKIIGDINDPNLKERVTQTLGEFEVGSDGKLAQSSPYRLVVLQDLLPKEKVLVARPRLQVAKEDKPDFMLGFYVDYGLALIPRKDYEYKINSALAKVLDHDLKSVGIDLNHTKLISYHILTYQVDNNSKSGLVFKLSERGKDIAKNSVFDTSDSGWQFVLYSSGLFRAVLGRLGKWYADYVNLADSFSNGRVVVETTGEAGYSLQKFLEEQLTKIREESAGEIREITEKTKRAENYIRTGNLE